MILIVSLRLAASANLVAAPAVDSAAGKVRVACIGDSITFGHGIKDREHNSYPARLAKLLGDKYEVRNFGVSGATAAKRGTRPYDQQEACSDALKSRPQIAVIMLGTNDTNKQTWPDHQQEFAADYSALIDSLRKASSGVQVFVCLPPPLVRDRGKAWDTDAILTSQVIPKIKSVAEKSNARLLDLNSIFADRAALLPDGVHPNAEGARLIAQTVHQQLQKQPVSKPHQE